MIAIGTAFQDLLAVLDRFEIQFLAGGSVASGTHGLARQTNDIDLLADIGADQIEPLCEALQEKFYVDCEDAKAAIAAGRAFNVIHLQGAYKFDLFPAGGDPFAQSELARRRYTESAITGLENIEFPVASPEDTVLSKLIWFRKGGEISERQWHDVLGVVRVQRDRLNREYLRDWAAWLGISDLLARALGE